MPRQTIPITPSVLTWARERAGLSLDDASQTFRSIAAWERGESFPTYPQLEKLSDALKVPVAVFFFPEPP
jgi:transcriptional regulator with XRE-family HTH domain